MERHVPRLLLTGTNSGCGKTTVTCAVLQALTDRGLRLGAFKNGPDYIDPMFHSRVIGAKSANLDLFFFDENTVRCLLAQNAAGLDVSVIEGAMGYYDGIGLTTSDASTYALSCATDSPTVLVIDAKGASLSLLAMLHGFLRFRADSRICGVIFNRCSQTTYSALAAAIDREFGGRVKAYGFLPNMADCALESRHLGLVTADEVADLREKLHLLARQAEKSIDLDGLLALANRAEKVTYTPIALPRYARAVRIAVARDRAFCFYYADSLDVLRQMGAEIVEFSPLCDAALPENIQGLYLGGGYPELYAAQLEQNASMRASIKAALARGLPCIAECGGFMYLTEAIGGAKTVGALRGACFDNHKLTRFGYVTLRAKHDNLLCRAGEEIRGHEFHHWDATVCGDGFTATKSNGKSWDCVVANERLYAGFPHFHFCSDINFAKNFYEACLEEDAR